MKSTILDMLITVTVKSKQLDSLKPRVMVMICGSGLKGVTHVHDVNNAIRVN